MNDRKNEEVIKDMSARRHEKGMCKEDGSSIRPPSPEEWVFQLYVPAFCDVDPKRFDRQRFSSPQAMMECEDIQYWAKKEGFYRFSQILDRGNVTLMAEFGEGHRWYVVGFVIGSLDIPVWKPVREDDNEPQE